MLLFLTNLFACSENKSKTEYPDKNNNYQNSSSNVSDDFIIIPGIKVGPIREYTSEKQLKIFFGDSNVVASDIPIGEGEEERGTILFPNDNKKKLSILWTNDKHNKISCIIINSDGTKWQTDKGITIGTTISELESLNKEPLIVVGFEWDGAGVVMHSKNGSLQELGKDILGVLSDRTLFLRALPKEDVYGLKEYRELHGDMRIMSNDYRLKKLHITVQEMIINFIEDKVTGTNSIDTNISIGNIVKQSDEFVESTPSDQVNLDDDGTQINKVINKQKITFSDYPTEKIHIGHNAIPIINSETRMYRTNIKNAANNNPNMGGRYIITFWGCGTGCMHGGYINSDTGETYLLPFGLTESSPTKSGFTIRQDIRTDINSDLVICIGKRDEKDNDDGIHYYKIVQGRLKYIKSVFFKNLI